MDVAVVGPAIGHAITSRIRAGPGIFPGVMTPWQKPDFLMYLSCCHMAERIKIA
jgi:hypothetical protein